MSSTLIGTCRTEYSVCMDFAYVFLPCAAHSMCFTGHLWGAGLASPPLACPSCSLRRIRTRFSPLKRFHRRCRGCCCLGEAFPGLRVPFLAAPGTPSSCSVGLISLHMSEIRLRTHQRYYGRRAGASRQAVVW